MENYIGNKTENEQKRLACNVGDRVYVAHKKFNKLLYGYIVEINLYKRRITIQLDSGNFLKTNSTSFKKTVFLTREEAENALKGVSNND